MYVTQILTASPADAVGPSVGLLIIRVVLGLLMIGHGAQKLLGWFGGYGLSGTAGFFEQIGFRPGRPFAAMAGASEIASGVLIALGLLGPIGPALLLSVMIVAAVSVHRKNGLFVTSNGIEMTLVYAGIGFALALLGPGRFSLDAALGIGSMWTPGIAAFALALGAVGGIANLIARRPVPAVPAAKSA